MTSNEMIYEIRERVRQFNLYDDDKLDDRMIKNWIHNQRALWLRNDLNKSHSVDEQLIQTLCMELEFADRSSCPEHLTGYTVLQTKLDIPKTIELNKSDGIISVGPIDKMSRPFSYVPIERARFSGNGRWNSNMIFTFRYGLKLLVISKNMSGDSFLVYMRYLGVRGIFENPEDVSNFTHIDGTACYSDDDEYPMNRWMWNYIRNQITEDNFKFLTSAPTDKVNDSNETLNVASNEE
jgi:hypothetical protein